MVYRTTLARGRACTASSLGCQGKARLLGQGGQGLVAMLGQGGKEGKEGKEGKAWARLGC